MTQQKIVETRWRLQGEGEDMQNLDDLDGYAKAIAFAENYRKSKLPPKEKSAPSSTQSSAEKATIESSSMSAKGGGGGRKNSESLLDLTGSNVVSQMENLEGITIQSAKMSRASSSSNSPNKMGETQKSAQNFKKDIETEGKGMSLKNKKATESQGNVFKKWKEHADKQKEARIKAISEEKTEAKTELTPKKDQSKKTEPKQPDPPIKDKEKLSIFSSEKAQSLSMEQKKATINSALSDLKELFNKGGDTPVGADGSKVFQNKYNLTINGNSKWSTVKALLQSQVSKVEEMIKNGGRRNLTEIDQIFKPVLEGKKSQGAVKISSNVLFDDNVNDMGFENPTPNASRAPSKASDA